MLSSLLRPKKRRRDVARSPFSSPSGRGDTSPEGVRRSLLHERRHPAADYDDENYDGFDGDEHHDDDGEEEDEENEDDDEEDDDEDGAAEDTPLLPIFSAVHLGLFTPVSEAQSLPRYSLTDDSQQMLSRFTL